MSEQTPLPITDDDPVTAEARVYANRVFRDAPHCHESYMMGVRFALEKSRAELERLKASVPTGDYVLTDDMSEETSKRWGKGLFCGFDDIKSVES